MQRKWGTYIHRNGLSAARWIRRGSGAAWVLGSIHHRRKLIESAQREGKGENGERERAPTGLGLKSTLNIKACAWQIGIHEILQPQTLSNAIKDLMNSFYHCKWWLWNRLPAPEDTRASLDIDSIPREHCMLKENSHAVSVVVFLATTGIAKAGLMAAAGICSSSLPCSSSASSHSTTPSCEAPFLQFC